MNQGGCRYLPWVATRRLLKAKLERRKTATRHYIWAMTLVLFLVGFFASCLVFFFTHVLGKGRNSPVLSCRIRGAVIVTKQRVLLHLIKGDAYCITTYFAVYAMATESYDDHVGACHRIFFWGTVWHCMTWTPVIFFVASCVTLFLTHPPCTQPYTHPGGGRKHDQHAHTKKAALRAGLVPVVHGDVAFDEELGGTVASTEEIFSFLARELAPRWVFTHTQAVHNKKH